MNRKSIKIKRRKRRGSISFNPDHQFVANAVENFLNGGGKIEHIEANAKSFEQSIMLNDGNRDADEFLLKG